jgi:glycosyltransferase involved in cell wall biosynthesis
MPLLQNRPDHQSATVTRVSPGAPAGRLEGVTLLRFAHAYESGGGLEQYLADLNLALGQRQRLTIVQIQLTTDRTQLHETEETIGATRLIKVPLWVPAESKHEAINGTANDTRENLKAALRNRLLFTPPVFRAFTKRYLRRWQPTRRAGEPSGAGEKFAELLVRFQIDLVVIHSSGGADAAEILSQAAHAKIPAVIVHHFANDRLKSLAIGQQSLQARGVGGVCGLAVPEYLQPQFTNLSDGIDTGFFRRQIARPVTRNSDDPVLFLPARLTPTKGQLDLIRAGGELLRQGLRFQIALAGRVDSNEFLKELQQEIIDAGLSDRVLFTGQLDAAGLRDWYATAAILAFPTRHHEGLPRILLEAQAMELPVVVHDIGGTSEGVQEGQTGFLVAVNDRPRLVQRLGELLRNPAQRQQFGQAGRRWIEREFSLDRLAERHESFYHHALNSWV